MVYSSEVSAGRGGIQHTLAIDLSEVDLLIDGDLGALTYVK